MPGTLPELLQASVLSGNRGISPLGTAAMRTAEPVPVQGIGSNPFVMGHNVGASGRNALSASRDAMLSLQLQRRLAEHSSAAALGTEQRENEQSGVAFDREAALNILLQRMGDQSRVAAAAAGNPGGIDEKRTGYDPDTGEKVERKGTSAELANARSVAATPGSVTLVDKGNGTFEVIKDGQSHGTFSAEQRPDVLDGIAEGNI